MKIIKVPRVPDDASLVQRIDTLLHSSFGGDAGSADGESAVTEAFPGQEPTCRFLLMHGSTTVAGHLAAYEREVVIGDDRCLLGMIGDVAVEKAFRRQGHSKKLVQAAHDYFFGKSIPFSVLFAFEPEVYESSGYRLMENEIYFLDADNVWNTFVYRGSMYCELGDQRWPNRKIDLKGPTV